MSEKLVLLTLQLSLQLDDVLKLLEAVPDSGKRDKKTHRKMLYSGCFSLLSLTIGIFKETIISFKILSLPELLKDWADFELPMSISRLFAGIQPSLPLLRFFTNLKKRYKKIRSQTFSFYAFDSFALNICLLNIVLRIKNSKHRSAYQSPSSPSRISWTRSPLFTVNSSETPLS